MFANEQFVNFESKKITDYESLKLSTTNTHPELLWEDATNLISNIFLTGNGEYINFEINKENIRQGNAVIAICNDEGTVMWSWHIWITPIVPAENNQIVDAHFSIM